jgi:predicted nucleic acid-binding protein
MDIAVDASVLIAVVAEEPEKGILINATKGSTLITPASTHWEVGNAFSAMLKRKRITMAEAEKAITIYNQIAIRFVEIDLLAALRLAERLAIYAYDAYLLECAQTLNCALLTLDQGLVRAAKRTNIQVIEV